MRIGSWRFRVPLREHTGMLRHLGAECFEIRKAADLNGWEPDGLVIPGGESTVMAKLLYGLKLLTPLRDKIADGLPVFGTCAGLILLAARVEGGAPCFACMDITVKRNAYGRQLGSFETAAQFAGIGEVPMGIYPRTVYRRRGDRVEVLARVDGRIVAARQENMLVTAFHPELAHNELTDCLFSRNGRRIQTEKRDARAPRRFPGSGMSERAASG